MDLDEHLQRWAGHARSTAQDTADELHLPDQIGRPRRRDRHALLVAASILLVLGLAAGLSLVLTRRGSNVGEPPSAGAGKPPADLSRRVECGSTPFEARQLTGPTIDLAGSTRADVAALRRGLTSRDGNLIAAPGGYAGRHWYAIRPNRTVTLFLTHMHAMSYVAAIVQREQGRWELTGSSGCVPARIFAGRSLGTITGATTSATSDDTLLIATRPGPCGTPLQAAQFHVTSTASWIEVTVTYPLPRAGTYTCPLPITPPPFALKLDEPINNRKIYDNGFLRPRLITHSPMTDSTTQNPIPKTPVK